MLDRSDLHALSTWCDARAISWSPAASEGGCPAILLETPDPGARRVSASRRGVERSALRRMLLVLGEDGFALLTERGETLATASELPAVLDAVENVTVRRPQAAVIRRGTRPRRVETTSGYVI